MFHAGKTAQNVGHRDENGRQHPRGTCQQQHFEKRHQQPGDADDGPADHDKGRNDADLLAETGRANASFGQEAPLACCSP